MDTTLRITATNLDAEDVQDLTREFSQTLGRETDIQTTLPEVFGGHGSKGDPVTFGTIVLTALTSGTVVALFNALKTYFERRPTLEMEFQRPDGQTFKVRAEILDKAHIDQTILLAKDFWGM